MPGTDRYTILEEIASGSTATVYLAEDTVLRRKVALKKLHPHLHNHVEMVKRFAKEAVAIAALSHENIIKVFEYGNQDRNLFLAMEYIDGMNLEALLKLSGGGLPNLVALSVFRQLLEGLGAAHARGIYHRDIKPSNVLVDRKGCVRIADFGIAFLSEETSITRTGSFLGTPGYSAPEQAEGLIATDKTDIFATGILFYRCLTGRLPFEGETPHAVLRAIMEKAPPKASAINRRILPGFQELFEAMLAKRVEERPTAVDCIQRIEHLARSTGFFFEPPRLARFIVDGAAYRAEEERDVSDGFLALARQGRSRGEVREALKFFAMAESFSPEPEGIRLESDDLLKRLRAGSRRKVALLALAASTLPAALGFWWFNRPAPVAPPPIHAPDTAPEKTASAPAPAVAAPSSPIAAPIVPSGSPEAARAPAAPPVPANASPSLAGAPTAKSPTAAAIPATAAPATTAAVKKPLRKPEAKPKIPPVPAPHPAAPTEPAVAATAGKAQPGYLVVKTSPPFAQLYVDGIEAGATPTRTPLEMKPGAHELILEREGCRPLHTVFQIAPNETTSLRLTMERSEGAAQ